MDKVIQMILEMVFTSLIVVFLLGYLIRGSINGGIGIWGGMGKVTMPESSTPGYALADKTNSIFSAQIPEIRCSQRQVSLNRTYELSELFDSESESKFSLQITDILLGQESVLARGDIAVLAEEETPAGALYDPGEDQLMFTKSGNYRIGLIVGTGYGRKPCKEVWLTIPATSSAVIRDGTGGN